MARVEHSNWSNPTNFPRWAGDPFHPQYLVRGGAQLEAAAFATTDAANNVTVTLTAGATADATSLAVEALSGAIPSGTVLYFGTGLFARTTANAAVGATTLTVEALPADIADESTATYDAPDAEPATTFVPAGTIVGRTTAELEAGDGLGPAAASDDEIFILAHDVLDASVNPDATLIRPRSGFTVKYNYLPGWDDLDAGVQALVAERYFATIGAA